MARRPAHAQRASRTRPRRGPGPGKCFPTWAAPAGPHVASRPSSSNGHALNPTEQNRRRRPRTLATSFILPRSLHLAPQRASDRGCRPTSDPTRGEETGPRRHLEPVASPQRHLSAHALIEMASAGSFVVSTPCAHPQAVHRQDLEPDHASASGGSGSTRAARRSAADGGLRGENK
jgi:hypothetical protein